MSPGDAVRIKHTGIVGTVTHPGRAGIPGRVYVWFPADDGLPAWTGHFHPSELEVLAG